MDEQELLGGIPPEELEKFLTFRKKVEGANISPQSLLATDYLNHFNEIIMMLEMIPDMPDCLEEAQNWHPKSYQDHFRDSSFSDKELAIAAYDNVPTKFRQPFEETIGQMNRLVEAAVSRADRAIAEDAPVEQLAEITHSASRGLQLLMDHASGIIHGSIKTMDQEEIDTMLAIHQL